MHSYPLDYRPILCDLPPTVAMAFRFHQGNKLLLFSAGQIHEGDLIEPARWAHAPAGLRVFIRLLGGHETAPIVGALIVANKLGDWNETDGCFGGLELDLNPDRPPGQEPVEGELVRWHRSHFQTLFVYWERAGKDAPKRDA